MRTPCICARPRTLLSALSTLLLVAAACAPSATPPAATSGGAATPAPKPTTAPAPAATNAPAATTAPAAAAAASPAAKPTAAAAAPAAGQGSLVVGQGYLPKTLDPNFDTSLLAVTTYETLFDTLVAADDQGNAVPALATSWRNTDPNTWEFKLRTGVKFTNGEPFDATAAKYTIDRILNPDVKSAWSTRLSLISETQAPAPDTLIIKTKQPFVSLPSNLTVAFILPPKYTEQQGVAGFGKAPVGTGPFKFVDWQVDDHLTLERNPDYWNGAPKLNRVILRNVPEESARSAALQAGDVQIAFPVSPDQVDQLKSRPDLKTPEIPLGQSLVITLRAVGTGPLEKKEVRQALNYAVDKQKLFDGLMQGHGRLLNGQIGGPETYGYNPQLQPYPYDVNKAKEMLASAGYPNGFDIQFQGPIGRYPLDQQVGEAIVAQLGQVGVKTRYEGLESGKFISSFLDGSSAPLYLWGWNLAPSMSMDQPLPYMTSASPAKVMADPDLDKLVQQQAAEFDPEKRRALLQQADAVIREDAPAIFLWQLPMIYGVSNKVGNFAAHSDGRIDLAALTLSP